MKDILILGAGKSASVLIEFLIEEGSYNDWRIHVADANPDIAASKTGGRDRAFAYGINLENTDQLNNLVDASDLVISMLPPSMHGMVAASCLQHGKHFLNASYLTPEILAMDEEAREKGLSFICEMGLDPGIDHMSAMEMIHGIKAEGGKIISFKSHCGGLISPESDDNPWHYKISWNPRNIVMAGKDGATFLDNNRTTVMPYVELFDPGRLVNIPDMGDYAWYPNRDFLPYIHKYRMEEASTFVRTTLRHPDFCRGWNNIVALNLTDDTVAYDTTSMTMREFMIAHCASHGLNLPGKNNLDSITQTQFQFLGLDSDEKINLGIRTAADVLQWCVERKLCLQPTDRDMIIMLHEIVYELDGVQKNMESSLVVKGSDSIHTAMAKTVGLPLAFAACHILNGNIQRRGVFIPVYPEIYNQILPDLRKNGISFSHQP